MKLDLALYVLGEVMQWDEERATEEFGWLSLMSRVKYDGYEDFLAGSRFIEGLAYWLQQFDSRDRETAYQFIRGHLVYIGAAELQHLVELAYPETVQRRLLRRVAESFGIPSYRIWARHDTTESYDRLLRMTLFLGLSDGARIDAFRRANAGVIKNEQVVVATQLLRSKWDELLADLRYDLADPTARFAFVYLIDDFVATGTTLLNQDEDGTWVGKLPRFRKVLTDTDVLGTHFVEDPTICVHHYLATHRGSLQVGERHALWVQQVTPDERFCRVEFSFGTILPADLPIDEDRHARFIGLIDKYYDPTLMTRSLQVGGLDARLGFGGCALPLILEHNTPNNSVACLWAETSGGNGYHSMRPLFRRRQRHL